MTTNLSRDEMTPLSVPVGYRFHPKEEELVNHYLKKKIHGGYDSEINQIIPFIDLCEHEPSELPGLLGTETEDDDMEWFFFTRNAYKYNKSSRSNRSTNKGFWKITGKEREIKARRSKAVIGKKRTLTYYRRGEAKRKKTGWVIHEYYLPRNEVVSCAKQEKGDFVICRLKNKSDMKGSSIGNEGEPGRGDDEMNQEGNGELQLHQPKPLDECCSSASQELEAVLQTNETNGDCHQLQSPFGERNEVSTCNEDETLYDVYPQLRDPPEENLDSLLCALQPQNYCPPILQSPIYTELGNAPILQSPIYILQSPIYTKLGNAPILQSPIYTELGNAPILQSPIYTELGNVTYPLQPQDYQPLVILQSPIYTKQGSVPTDRVDIPVRHVMSNVENQAPDYWSQEVPHPQTEVNQGSAVYPFQPQASTLPPQYGDACTLTCQSHWQGSTMGIVE